MDRIEKGASLQARTIPGTGHAEAQVSCSDSTQAMIALCEMISTVAAHLGMTRQEVICRIAVVLMADTY